ncbi:hypothetical protein RUND412_010847 [Rhizina undulata]
MAGIDNYYFEFPEDEFDDDVGGYEFDELDRISKELAFRLQMEEFAIQDRGDNQPGPSNRLSGTPYPSTPPDQYPGSGGLDRGALYVPLPRTEAGPSNSAPGNRTPGMPNPPSPEGSRGFGHGKSAYVPREPLIDILDYDLEKEGGELRDDFADFQPEPRLRYRASPPPRILARTPSPTDEDARVDFDGFELAEWDFNELPPDPTARELPTIRPQPRPAPNPATTTTEQNLDRRYRYPRKSIAGEKCTACNNPLHALTFHGYCSHPYCRSCYTNIVTASVKGTTAFPPACCNIRLPTTAIKYALDHEDLVSFLEKFAEYKSRYKIYCPRTSCGKLIPDEDVVDGVGTCGKCGGRACAECKKVAHGGACVEDGDVVALKRLAQTEGWKQCKCGEMVDKIEGCNHMTCRCGREFCYTCGAVWRTCKCPHYDAGGLELRYANYRYNREDFE